MESLKRNIEDLNSDMTVSCEYLLCKLKELFEYSLRHSTQRQTKASRKPAWARIAVQSASVMASILKNVELEELRDEIEALKR